MQAAPTGLDLAVDRLHAGRVTAALEDLEALRAEEPSALPGLSAEQRTLVLESLVECRLARGELSEAALVGIDLEPYIAPTGLPAARARHARGGLATAAADADTAVEEFLAAGDALAGHPADPGLPPWRASAAVALVRCGRRREAADLAREHHRLAARSGSAYAVALALRTRACADADATAGDRRRLLRDAHAAALEAGAARLVAQVAGDLAGLLLLEPAESGKGEVLELLRRAEEYAGRQELWPLLSRVRRLLDRLGQRPRRYAIEALAALTRGEQRVVRLAVDGLSNRQIATELSVSVKAVEWHLSQVYRKLDVGSRVGLRETVGAPA